MTHQNQIRSLSRNVIGSITSNAGIVVINSNGNNDHEEATHRIRVSSGDGGRASKAGERIEIVLQGVIDSIAVNRIPLHAAALRRIAGLTAELMRVLEEQTEGHSVFDDPLSSNDEADGVQSSHEDDDVNSAEVEAVERETFFIADENDCFD